jgi:hypothetical protein
MEKCGKTQDVSEYPTDPENTTLVVSHTPTDSPATDQVEKSVYSIVLIYENQPTLERAHHFGESLKRQLGESIPWTTDAWELSMLQVPPVRRAATDAAAIADIVLLSLEGYDELTDGFKAWMEEWGGRLLGESPILIALFSAPGKKYRTLAASLEFLGEIAETCGLTFLHSLGDSVVEYRPQKSAQLHPKS